MPSATYDKPIRYLLRDMVAAFDLKPGQVFTASRAFDWFQQNYPKLKATGLRNELTRLSTNDRNRLYARPKAEDDLLYSLGSGQYRLYEPGKDPAPLRAFASEDIEREQVHQAEEVAEAAAADSDPATAARATEFLLEKDLQNYLARNLERIEPGLKLYQDADGVRGIEYDAGGRHLDILAPDRSNAFVVLEFKVSKGYDRVIGQLLRYMNWVRQNQQPAINACAA